MGTSINLSLLPAPGVVEALDVETILAECKAKFIELYPEFTADLESESSIKLLEVLAYREVLVRQRINEAAVGVMLAFAVGPDLDQVGANYLVTRLLLKPADDTTIPPTPAVYESDDDFRERIQLSPEGFTTAGSVGSYNYHARTADAAVKDAQTVSPSPGVVVTYIMSRYGDGSAGPELVSKVNAALNSDEVRPLTDSASTKSAEIIGYDVVAELTLYDGPDEAVVLKAAADALKVYAESVRKIGYDVTLSGLYGALHRPGVQAVNLIAPVMGPEGIVIVDGQASYMKSAVITKSASRNV